MAMKEVGAVTVDNAAKSKKAKEVVTENKAVEDVKIAKKELSTRPIYRIDIPANRIDLLCPEGLTRALKVYLGGFDIPKYKVVCPKKPQQLLVKAETGQIRPYAVAAILRDITFTQESYNNFIDLQEKLHGNICRNRKLVAIGTHDLDTIEGPFFYEALPPKDINFIPLSQTSQFNGETLFEYYRTEKTNKLKKYLHIIEDSPVFPVIKDRNGIVLSLPPIINSEHSKIKLTTKNVFIECTATDLTKAKIVLNDVVLMFSEYCKEKFTVEAVEVINADKSKVLYPDLSSRIVETTTDFISSCIGVSKNILTPQKIVSLLKKMSVEAKNEGEKIIVQVPPTRSDILHPCDIMEDVAVAYGFNNIPESIPNCNTVSAPFNLNKFSDQIRYEIALCGYTEVLPLILCSHDENFAFLQKMDDLSEAVKLANPKTFEYQVVRTSLMPGILKTLKESRKHGLPLKLFEVSDVVFKDDSLERRARNQRNICVAHCDTHSGFGPIHGVLDALMIKLGVKHVKIGEDNGYYIKESKHPTYFQGRKADIYYNNKVVGVFGVVHPSVLRKFEISYPTSCLELNIEPFL
ncbi:hypothetical protein HK099_006984 [Clydaea vesicula]|uniref:phenylalanine--tRNA ligase n=1 Tax=Clydaea vesicula TaxID=447962 RepID=A0AAD5TXN3_9FUNG|nr:hypothetical protein HK099_006984 [Clydaea vesicula]